MSENGEIYTAGQNFTLPPALTGWTNSTSECTAIVLGYVYLPSDATTPPLVRSNSWTAASAQPPF